MSSTLYLPTNGTSALTLSDPKSFGCALPAPSYPIKTKKQLAPQLSFFPYELLKHGCCSVFNTISIFFWHFLNPSLFSFIPSIFCVPINIFSLLVPSYTTLHKKPQVLNQRPLLLKRNNDSKNKRWLWQPSSIVSSCFFFL